MRLLVVAPVWHTEQPSGRLQAFARLVELLSARHRVRLVVGYRTERSAIPGDALGVDLRGASAVTARLALWRAIRAASRRFGPDVWLGSGAELPPGRVPSVAVVRDLVQTGWESPSIPQVWARRMGLRRHARVVVPTLAALQELREAGAPRWSLVRLPDPVSIPPRSAPVDPTRPKLVLVHPGRIHPAKGQHLSVDAVSRLTVEEKARVSLHVVGPVADKRYLDQLKIAARGQPVTLHPGEEPLAPWLRRAQVVLYPTCVPEGFADLAVLAMAHERPVIWSDHPGVRESLGGLGCPIPPDDALALRAAIRRVLSDSAALRGPARQGRRFVARRYAWEVLAPRWEEVLEGARRTRF